MIKLLLSIILFASFLFAGELEVDGDLKVTGNIDLGGIFIDESNIAFSFTGAFSLYILTKSNDFYRLSRESADSPELINWIWDVLESPPIENVNEIVFINSNASAYYDTIETIFLLTTDGILYGFHCDHFNYPCYDGWDVLPNPPFEINEPEDEE